MAHRLLNVLFLGTGNSARSLFAEAATNRLGRGRFQAFSAGSRPAGEVDPLAIYELERNNFQTGGLRSKSWEEFAGADGPALDFVFTVCDELVDQPHPEWRGEPMMAHWGVTDPVSADEGDELARKAAYHRAFAELESRVSIFVNLPLDSLDRLKLQRKLHEIGNARLEDSAREA